MRIPIHTSILFETRSNFRSGSGSDAKPKWRRIPSRTPTSFHIPTQIAFRIAIPNVVPGPRVHSEMEVRVRIGARPRLSAYIQSCGHSAFKLHPDSDFSSHAVLDLLSRLDLNLKMDVNTESDSDLDSD